MRQLIFIGTGTSNLRLMRALARLRQPGLQMRCITEDSEVMNPASLPEYISGQRIRHHSQLVLSQCLATWGVECLKTKVQAIDPIQQTIMLHDESTLHYDWLALNSTPQPYRASVEQRIPGARKNGFFIYPIERFAQQWDQLCQQIGAESLRMSILGDTLRSMELALAVRQRFPGAAVTWIAEPLARCKDEAAYPALLAVLKAQRIDALHDTVLAIEAQTLQLQCGAQLANDVPIIALQPTAPEWVAAHPETVWFEAPDSICCATGYHAVTGKAWPQIPIGSQIETYYAGSKHGIAQWQTHTLAGHVAGWLRNQKNRLGGLYTH
jgi:NAD(P)H-nitrite reductase large subunit